MALNVTDSRNSNLAGQISQNGSSPPWPKLEYCKLQMSPEEWETLKLLQEQVFDQKKTFFCIYLGIPHRVEGVFDGKKPPLIFT